MHKTLLSLAAVALTVALASSFVVADDHKNKDKKDATAAVTVGGAAPLFSLQDQDGKTVNLADFKDKVVVLEWFNNECPYVVKHYRDGHMNQLAEKYAGKGVVWLAINTTKNKTNADNKAIAGEWKIDRPILNDSTGEVGRAYGARTTPHMYIVNKGQLAYMGAIDDKRGSDTAEIKDAKNYVAQALDQILSGQSVSEPETKPYGCSVKYAKN